MRNIIAKWHAQTLVWHRSALEAMLLSGILAFVMVPSASAAMRLQDRSLYMNSSDAGETTFYRLSFRYMSPDPVGSFELLFCMDPIPHHACVPPTGFSAASAALGEQLGEVGFSIAERSTNRLLLARTGTTPLAPDKSSYVFNNMRNPTTTEEAFSIRIKTFSSMDGSGPQVDFGSVRAQITEGVTLQTQVPPMLIFCLAQQVHDNCTGTNEIYSSDLGELSDQETVAAQSQMAVGTNASAGFSIAVHGTTMTAGTNTIRALEEPTESRPGTGQFGINLVANTTPEVGGDPEGEWANAVASPDYSQPDKYKFVSGDTVAYSPSVSLMKKFTVSYIVNSGPSVKPGVYTTTVNFIASGRF